MRTDRTFGELVCSSHPRTRCGSPFQSQHTPTLIWDREPPPSRRLLALPDIPSSPHNNTALFT